MLRINRKEYTLHTEHTGVRDGGREGKVRAIHTYFLRKAARVCAALTNEIEVLPCSLLSSKLRQCPKVVLRKSLCMKSVPKKERKRVSG
jgi:hypothetical protein